MPQENTNQNDSQITREIIMPDGSTHAISMASLLWEKLEFIELMDEITPTEVAHYALEEVEIQGISLENAFRAVVAHFANRWD